MFEDGEDLGCDWEWDGSLEALERRREEGLLSPEMEQYWFEEGGDDGGAGDE